jgi:hypothetical protein
MHSVTWRAWSGRSRPCTRVVYNGSGYAAWPQQFRVGCWRGFDGDAAAATPTDTFASAPNCSSPAQVLAPTVGRCRLNQ